MLTLLWFWYSSWETGGTTGWPLTTNSAAVPWNTVSLTMVPVTRPTILPPGSNISSRRSSGFSGGRAPEVSMLTRASTLWQLVVSTLGPMAAPDIATIVKAPETWVRVPRRTVLRRPWESVGRLPTVTVLPAGSILIALLTTTPGVPEMATVQAPLCRAETVPATAVVPCSITGTGLVASFTTRPSLIEAAKAGAVVPRKIPAASAPSPIPGTMNLLSFFISCLLLNAEADVTGPAFPVRVTRAQPRPGQVSGSMVALSSALNALANANRARVAAGAI